MIKAKKRFGQNFLKDDYFKNKIIQAIPNSNRVIVEIGSGLGDLTKKLIVSKDKIIAFEVDEDLCPILKRLFKEELKNQKLILHCKDVLEVWREQSLIIDDYNLVANLPYYIATKIILKALEDFRCKTILVMVQREVAEKFCAKSGEKEFSSLSILTNIIGRSELLFDVPKDAFEPPPRVTSSILKITKEREFYGKENAIFKDREEFSQFQNFLKIAFSNPRKMVIKNLSSKFEKRVVEEIFNYYKIDLTSRPHQLLISNYHLIFNNLKRGNLYGKEEL